MLIIILPWSEGQLERSLYFPSSDYDDKVTSRQERRSPSHLHVPDEFTKGVRTIALIKYHVIGKLSNFR